MIKPFIYRPVNPYTITQRFGEKKACIDNRTKKVFSTFADNACPVGSRSLYPPGGHNGLDLSAAAWQYTYSPIAGVVIEKQTEIERGLGLGIVTHTPQFCAETGTYEFMKIRIWHFIQLEVDLGEHVTLGALIGCADNTGYSAGDHAHLEAKPVRRVNGVWVNILQDNGSYGAIDPAPYMVPMFALEAATTLQRLKERLARALEILAEYARYQKRFIK